MKRVICITLSLILCISALLTGCVQNVGERPDSFTGVRWISPDYSMRFTPEDDCKGSIYINEVKYNIQLEFESNWLTVYDTGKNNNKLFTADWMYEENERLYIYNISFNKDDYSELKGILIEFITLRKEKLDK